MPSSTEELMRRVVRWKAVRASTGLSRTTITALEAEGEFPQRVRLGRRAVGWYEDEVITWLATRERRSA